MSKAFKDLDDRIDNKDDAQYGRIESLKQADVPLQYLVQNGVDVPEYYGNRSYNPENARTIKTTHTFHDAPNVHLHQNVRELTDGAFGDLPDDDTLWIVTNLGDEKLTLKVVGEWSKVRHVEYGDFVVQYEPVYLKDGTPQWGY